MTATVGERPTTTAADLMDAAKAGDRDAYGRLWAYYNNTVFRFIYHRVRNVHLAQDLTADVFARALKNLDHFTWQGRAPSAWLVTIARNLVADYFKSGRYRIERLTGGAHGEAEQIERIDDSPLGNPEQAVTDHLTNVALLRAVQQLTAEQQQVIILRYLHGLNSAETAALLGVNVGAVKAMQYRATRALARLVPASYAPTQRRSEDDQ